MMNPSSALQSPFTGQMLTLFSRNEIHHVPVTHIIRLEADSNYTYIYLVNHKKLFMAKVLSAYESILAPLGFIRTHRSHLVNPMYVQALRITGEVIMTDDSRVEVSRRKKKMVKNLFGAGLRYQEMPLLTLSAAS